MVYFDKLKLGIPLNLCSDINKDLFDDIIDGNLFVSKKIIQEILGVITLGLDYAEGLFIVEITGKINAENHNLGLINQQNIIDTLEKINKLGFVKFKPEDVISQTKVFMCDITQDIFIKNNDIGKILFDLKQKLQVNSNRYYITKHPNSGISVRPVAKTRKEVFNIYPKYKELHLKKHDKYRSIIGYDYLEEIKNLIRVELQLKSYKLMRHYFSLVNKSEIMLEDLLMSSENPLMMKLAELGISEDYMNGRNDI